MDQKKKRKGVARHKVFSAEEIRQKELARKEKQARRSKRAWQKELQRRAAEAAAATSIELADTPMDT